MQAQLVESFGADNVQAVASNGSTSYRLNPGGSKEMEEAVFDLVAGNQWKLLELRREAATLETVFRNKTLAANAATGGVAHA